MINGLHNLIKLFMRKLLLLFILGGGGGEWQPTLRAGHPS